MSQDTTAGRPAGKRIAITGAGSGLGRELALRYARDGWHVAVTDIQAERARQVAEEVVDAGGSRASKKPGAASIYSSTMPACPMPAPWWIRRLRTGTGCWISI